jgi:hypothetical protein
VAANPPARELLNCWDTSMTEKVQKQQSNARKKKAQEIEKEELEKKQRQEEELEQAITEAERKTQIARSELARARKLLVDYRQQKVNFAQQGLSDRLAELEPLLEGAEAQVKMYEAAKQDWEWKKSRAELKKQDFQQLQREKEAKKSGAVQGFRVELRFETAERLLEMLPKLTAELEVQEAFDWEGGISLKKGDALIKDGPFAHLRKSEFTRKMLEDYAQSPPERPPEEAHPAEAGEEAPPSFPLVLSVARGFDRTIDIKGVADVLLKDIGGFRQKDGRWPLIIDPSGRTSTFVQYTGAAVFHINQLTSQEVDPLRLRRAFLKGLMHGGCLLIDLGGFDFGTEVVAEPWNRLEPGLFGKLVDRAALYSYLLPKRFHSLITPEVKGEFMEGMFFDEAIAKFVFGFVTSFGQPEFDFARQFYTIRVRTPDDEDGATGGA